MEVGALGNDVADVYPHAESDALIGGMTCIVVGCLLLHSYRTADRSIDAVEQDQQ